MIKSIISGRCIATGYGKVTTGKSYTEYQCDFTPKEVTDKIYFLVTYVPPHYVRM